MNLIKVATCEILQHSDFVDAAWSSESAAISSDQGPK